MPTNNSGRSGLTAIIASITILLVAVMIVLLAFRYPIKRMVRTSENHASKQVILETFEKYLDERNYVGLANYADQNRFDMGWGTALYEYSQIRYAASSYSYLMSELIKLHLDADFSYRDYFSTSVAGYIENIYRYEKSNESHIEYMETLVDDMELMLKTYLHLSDEEIAALPDMSDAARSYLIEEKVKVILDAK